MEQPQPYVTIAEAARELRVSRSTLNRFLGDELPIHRFGRSVRIAPDDLAEFKRACRQHPTGDGADQGSA